MYTKTESPISFTMQFLLFALSLLFMTMTNQSSSARTHHNLSSPQHRRHHHHHRTHAFTFVMHDVLNSTRRISRPTQTSKATNHNHQFPFSKPLGIFPPIGGIPQVQPNPTRQNTNMVTQTFDLSNIGLPYSGRATLQDLEFGTVIVIDEEIFERKGLDVLGKAKGIYVVSSENGRHGHMIAMNVFFRKGESKDSLRFFGVKISSVSESHVAVIGGTGKYDNANGYAKIKTTNYQSEGATYKLLYFNVYLSI